MDFFWAVGEFWLPLGVKLVMAISVNWKLFQFPPFLNLLTVPRAEDGEGEGVEGLKAEEEVPKRKRSEEPEEDNVRKKLKTESLMEMSESNSCDSSIFMSISSGNSSDS